MKLSEPEGALAALSVKTPAFDPLSLPTKLPPLKSAAGNLSSSGNASSIPEMPSLP